jgi:diguanylate cyclase (GGDEF)-like protein
MITQTDPLHLLLIEDNPGDARLIQEMLKDSGITLEVTHLTRLSEIKAISPEKYNLVLLDLNLPDSSGLQTVLKTHELLPLLPIVVLTGLDNEELSLAAIQSGAQDYLVKNKTDSVQLVKTIQYALRRHTVLKQISEANNTHVTYLTTHNVLTGFPNQQLFLERIKQMIAHHENLKKNFAISFLEIHELPKITSSYGHHIKDDLIKKISIALSEELPQSVFIAHYSENVFALLHPKSSSTTLISKDISFIQLALARVIQIADLEYFPSYNMGIAIYPFDGQEAEQLIKNAQTALNKSTLRGVREYDFYMKTLYSSPAENEVILYSDIKAALENKNFFIVYQPQIHLEQKKVVGVEALLRWKHPKLGMIPPQKFIHTAEDMHLITLIGTWVLETAAKQYKTWEKHHKGHLPLRISINISVLQLHNDGTVFKVVKNILDKYKIPPECFELELTESIFIEQADLAIEKLNKLKKLGIKIAIDDFGQGYSALSYLSHLPVDRLKLDMAFVKKNLKGSPTSLVVESIIKLAHSLQLKVIAEGVETEEQLNILNKQNCDEVQGYYFSKPVEEKDIATIISNDLHLK